MQSNEKYKPFNFTVMNKYFFSILFQATEEIEYIDVLDCDICKKVVETYKDRIFDEDENDFTDYEPYIGKYDYFIDSHREWTLVKNDSVFGCYMLYREATKSEVDRLNSK